MAGSQNSNPSRDSHDPFDPFDPCACRFEAGLVALGRDFVIVETLETRTCGHHPLCYEGFEAMFATRELADIDWRTR